MREICFQKNGYQKMGQSLSKKIEGKSIEESEEESESISKKKSKKKQYGACAIQPCILVYCWIELKLVTASRDRGGFCFHQVWREAARGSSLKGWSISERSLQAVSEFSS